MPLIRTTAASPALPGEPDRDAALLALRGGAPAGRWAAARALAGFAEAAPALGQALGAEADARVREAILTGLVRIGGTAGVQAVLPHLRSDDAQLRGGALDALKAMPAAADGSLADLLADPDPDIRVLACDLARELPSPDTGRLLARLLETDPEANVCAAALDALAEIGEPESLPSLARCAERFADRPFLGFAAQAAAGRIGARDASPPGVNDAAHG